MGSFCAAPIAFLAFATPSVADEPLAPAAQVAFALGAGQFCDGWQVDDQRLASFLVTHGISPDDAGMREELVHATLAFQAARASERLPDFCDSVTLLFGTINDAAPLLLRRK